jgi:GntR family transcriptional regulator
MASNILDKKVPSPLYEQIASWIQEQVLTGEWPINHKLKSEDELAAELSVSRGTVRKAIRLLVSKEVLVQIHGRGTFVASKKYIQPLGQRLISFAEAMAEQGLVYKTQVLSKDVIPAPAEIATRLSCQVDESLFYLKRIRSAGDGPVMLLENYVRQDLCPNLMQVDFENNTLFSAIEEMSGIRIAWGKRDFEACNGTDPQAKLLNVSPGSALLYLEQIIYTNDDTPIETSNVWIRGDQFRLTSIINR